MIDRIVELCPHLQRFREDPPINLEDILYAIRAMEKQSSMDSTVSRQKDFFQWYVSTYWDLKKDYRDQTWGLRKRIDQMLTPDEWHSQYFDN